VEDGIGFEEIACGIRGIAILGAGRFTPNDIPLVGRASLGPIIGGAWITPRLAVIIIQPAQSVTARIHVIIQVGVTASGGTLWSGATIAILTADGSLNEPLVGAVHSGVGLGGTNGGIDPGKGCAAVGNVVLIPLRT
jgi:hypothetical protein